jgi:hypothetical protein
MLLSFGKKLPEIEALSLKNRMDLIAHGMQNNGEPCTYHSHICSLCHLNIYHIYKLFVTNLCIIYSLYACHSSKASTIKKYIVKLTVQTKLKVAAKQLNHKQQESGEKMTPSIVIKHHTIYLLEVYSMIPKKLTVDPYLPTK